MIILNFTIGSHGIDEVVVVEVEEEYVRGGRTKTKRSEKAI